MLFVHFGGLGSRFNCWEQHTTHKVSGVHKLSKSLLFYVNGVGRAEEAALCTRHQASLAVLCWLGRDLLAVRHSGHY
jgi:hypothetical protein